MIRFSILILCLLLTSNYAQAGNKFLERYCLDCHNNKKHKGGINLQKFSHKDLYAAIEQLELGEMPPKKYKIKPTQKGVSSFINSVKKYLQKQKPVTKVHYKWMMKSEHERALKNFFGVDVKSALPERSDNGFHMPDSKFDSDSITPEYLEKVYKLNNVALDQTYLQKHKIHEMIIALDVHEHEKLLDIIGEFNLFDICIKVIPDMYEAITGQVRIDTIRGLALLNINPDIMTEFQSIIKRFIDIILSVSALVILFPINVLIGLIIHITSAGGIFYTQIRMGLNGNRFTLIKFRTMHANSEKTTGPVWADKDDPRITAIGKVLRKYHLDEIPQLLNVLRGNMCIVGPRPERPQIIDDLVQDIPYYSRRLKVRPGITGWAQIMGAYDSSVADVNNKLKHDFYYIENMSLLLDIKIIFLTIWAVFRGKGY